MPLFEKGQIPWNKGIPTKNERCTDCGTFIGGKTEHICKSVEKRGPRYCKNCIRKLKSTGWERYSKICGPCGKKIQRENERKLREELIQIFGGKCKKCGYDDFKECLEFHHLKKGEKRNKHFLKQVKKHSEHFELLCNRCHRETEVLIKRDDFKIQFEL